MFRISVAVAIVGGAALWLVGVAAAQDTLADRLAACSREESDTARLACFDAIAKASASPTGSSARPAEASAAAPPASVPAPSPPAPRGLFGELARDPEGRVASSGNWRVRRERDSMTDQPRVFLSMIGETDQGRTNDPPLLTFRCFQGRLEAFVAVGAFIGSGDSRPTRLRFDRAEPVAQSWSSSTSGTAVFSPDPRGFADRLARSERLLVEVAAFGGDRYRLAFDLVGFPDVLPEIAACRRPPQPAQQPRPQGQR
jgi:hypothetical protein